MAYDIKKDLLLFKPIATPIGLVIMMIFVQLHVIYGVFLGSCLLSKTAEKQTAVAHSNTEAEYQALAITTAELYWVRMLLKELCIPLPIPPTIWRDNIGALALASNLVLVSC